MTSGDDKVMTFTLFATRPPPPLGAGGPNDPFAQAYRIAGKAGGRLFWLKIALLGIVWYRTGSPGLPLRQKSVTYPDSVGIPDVLFDILEEFVGLDIGDIAEILSTKRGDKDKRANVVLLSESAKIVVFTMAAWRKDP